MTAFITVFLYVLVDFVSVCVFIDLICILSRGHRHLSRAAHDWKKHKVTIDTPRQAVIELRTKKKLRGKRARYTQQPVTD